MRLRTLIAMIVVGVTVVATALSGVGKEWELVNKAVRLKGIPTAIGLLESAAQSDPANPDLKYDLGTAYMMDGKMGPAVWNLEKALDLSPRDRGIRANLLAAHQRVREVPTATPILDAVVNGLRWVTLGEAAWGWLGVTTLLAGLVLGWGVHRVSWITLRRGALAWVIITMPVAIRVWDAMSPRGVVIVPTLKLRILPDAGAASICDVPPGTVVRLTGFRVGWIQIQLPDGMTGWGTSDDIRSL